VHRQVETPTCVNSSRSQIRCVPVPLRSGCRRWIAALLGAAISLLWQAPCSAQRAVPGAQSSGAAVDAAQPADPEPPPLAPLPPSAAPAAEPPRASAEYESYDEPPSAAKEPGPHCLLAGFCLGPVLTAGIFDVFGVGVHGRTDYWGVGFDYQFVRFTTHGIPVRLSLLTVEGRLYPFGGAFFLAGGLAWQSGSFRGHVTYPGDNQVPPIETDISGSVNVPVFKLGAGFMGRDGFVMGIDVSLGLQLGRTRVSFSSELPRVQQVIDVENSIRNRADTWIRGLPFLLQVNVLRFGFLF
jgi:hypothetical protein